MKDKIKYLIYKLFVYKNVDMNSPQILSCLTNILKIYYPDFSLKEILKMMENIYNFSNYAENTQLSLTGFNKVLVNKNDYNELYIELFKLKKSLTYSDSFEP